MKKTPSSIRIGYRYRASRVDDHYDAIVIGSGPSGLSTAANLSQMGKKVAVLEQHYTAGGFTHAYSRNGYEWDVGVHFLNDLVDRDHFIRRLFDFISDKKLQWNTLEKEKILLSYGNTDRIAVTILADEDKENLKRRFPEEAEAIEAFYLHSNKVVKRATGLLAIQKLSSSGFFGRLISKLATSLLPKDIFRSSEEVVKDFTDNEMLTAILTCLWVACGLTPDKQSYFFLAGGLQNQSRLSYPQGGSSEISKTIMPVIQKSGGNLFTYAKVEKILVDNNRTLGVEMTDGHRIYAPYVVSSAGASNTFRHLLPNDVLQKYGYDKLINQVERTTAHFNLFIGFNETNEALGLHTAEHLIFNSTEYAKDMQAFNSNSDAPLPMLYVTFPSAKDPTWNERYPGKSTSSVFMYIDDFEKFSQWRNEQWEKRGEDYDALKEEIAQRMLESLFKHYPHLRDKLDYYELSTPLSTRYFCMYEHGEIYGLQHDTKRASQSWLKSSTRIKGLYLTGQDTLSLGHTTAVISGFITASKVLGIRKARALLKRISA